MEINVKVKINKSKQELIKIDDKNYIAYLKVKPKKGMANLELIKLISKELKKGVIIKKGFKSKNKVIEVV